MTRKKTYTSETFKTREEWLASRGIGGSSASAIAGMNPWKTALELYQELVFQNAPKKEQNSPILQYGHDCEVLIRKQLALDLADTHTVKGPKGYTMYRSTKHPYMTATIDGMLREKTGEKRKGILEIKTHEVRRQRDLTDWENGIPSNYLIQVLHYLLVLNDFDFVKVVAKLNFFDYDRESKKAELTKTEYRYYHIEREDVKAELEWLERIETEFYEENVKKGIPPQAEIKF